MKRYSKGKEDIIYWEGTLNEKEAGKAFSSYFVTPTRVALVHELLGHDYSRM